MENLQNLETSFQQLLQNWYQLTLDNKGYAIFLVIAACLIMAVFYSIRIGFLKRNQTRTVNAKNAIQASLDETNEQLRALQEQCDEATELKLQAEQQAEAQTQHLQASNNLLAGSLSRMAECFELNRPNPPSADAENLLTEYEAVLAGACERFQNEQQTKTQLQLTLHSESAKLAEKEMLATSLQNRLDGQAAQLSKLETAVEQFENAQRQLEADKERLAKEMETRHAQAVRELELEKQKRAASQEPVQEALTDSNPGPVEADDSIEEPEAMETAAAEPVNVAETVAAVPVDVAQPDAVTPEPESGIPESEQPETITAPQPETLASTEGGKKKGLFGRTIEKFIKMDEKLGNSGENNAAPEPSEMEQTAEPLSQTETESESPDPIEASAETAQPEKTLGEKLSSLLGSFKKPTGQKAEQATAAAAPLSESADDEQNQVPRQTSGSSSVIARLTGLFGSSRATK